MLRWRLLSGTLIASVLVGLAWLDHLAEVHHPAIPTGVGLLPVAVFFSVAATHEVLRLIAAGGMRPVPWTVYGGNLLLVAGGWLSGIGRFGETAPAAGRIAWLALALASGLILALLAEMRRYEKPGGTTANVAGAALALIYVGLMLGFAVGLRIDWGVGALASLVIVVKMGDVGAYTIGRLLGRHPMAPVLSPRKTIEGAIGALAFACLASWVTFRWIVPPLAPPSGIMEPCAAWRWVLFALLLGAVGMVGDLAESLFKRDAGIKDSSRWLPGLGGVLDILHSILLAAPIAWCCWAFRLVGV